MKKIVSILAILSLACGVQAGPELVGTTSSNFIKIPPLARASGMGEAFTAVSDGTAGIYYNPAGLSLLSGYEVQATHTEWFQDLRHEYLSAAFPFMENVKAGVSLSWFRVESMPATKELPSYEPAALDSTDYTKFIDHYFSPYDYSASLAFGFDAYNDLAAGVSLRFTSQNIDKFSGSNLTTDIGLLYKVYYNDSFLRLGICASNLGSEIKMDEAAFEPPKIVKAGISDQFILWNGKFLAAAQAIIQADYDPLYSLGAEYWIFDILALRGGYKIGAFEHPTYGAGIKYAGFEFDYAFVTYEELGATHRFSLLYSWGTPPVKLKVAPAVFSPNADTVLDTAVFTPVYKTRDKLNSAVVRIFDQSGKTQITELKSDNGQAGAFKWSGTDGMAVLPDGIYSASLKAQYESGSSESPLVRVEIDNTPPTMQIDAQPKLLKPGQDDKLLIPATFTFYAEDRNRVVNWQFVIWDKDKKVFTSTGGQGEPPLSYIWDGKANDGRYVDTGDIYYYSLITTDSVGNKAQTKPLPQVVLLKEIKLTFSSDALFETGKADVRISAYSALKEMRTVLNKYPESEILVAGYTDNIQPSGDKYKNNTELSKARAEAVKFFMVNLLSMDENRISTEGFGELYPIASNDTQEGRLKNRRVEVTIQSTIYK